MVSEGTSCAQKVHLAPKLLTHFVLAITQKLKATDHHLQFVLILGALILDHNPDQQGRCRVAEVALDEAQCACVAQQAVGVSVCTMIAGDRCPVRGAHKHPRCHRLLDHPLCRLVMIDFDDLSEQQPVHKGLIRYPRSGKGVPVLNLNAVPLVQLPRAYLIERKLRSPSLFLLFFLAQSSRGSRLAWGGRRSQSSSRCIALLANRNRVPPCLYPRPI